MPNDKLSAALKEAYATAPTSSVILHTIELRHPDFVDDEGNITAIRVVRNNEDITATLEADAPLNPGESVTFTAFSFDFTLPAVKDNELPRLLLTIDNVGQEIIKHLEAAIADTSPIDITYRPYLSDDLAQPEMDPPLSLVMTDVKVDVLRVVGTCTFDDLINRTFPGELYTRDKFPALTA